MIKSRSFLSIEDKMTHVAPSSSRCQQVWLEDQTQCIESPPWCFGIPESQSVLHLVVAVWINANVVA